MGLHRSPWIFSSCYLRRRFWVNFRDLGTACHPYESAKGICSPLQLFHLVAFQLPHPVPYHKYCSSLWLLTNSTSLLTESTSSSTSSIVAKESWCPLWLPWTEDVDPPDILTCYRWLQDTDADETDNLQELRQHVRFGYLWLALYTSGGFGVYFAFAFTNCC